MRQEVPRNGRLWQVVLLLLLVAFGPMLVSARGAGPESEFAPAPRKSAGIARELRFDCSLDPANGAIDGLANYFEFETYESNCADAEADRNSSDGHNEVIRQSGQGRLMRYISSIKADSDNDFLSDGEEVNVYGTDPNDFDTDDDGLVDATEVLICQTDPLTADSDGDGVNDYDEVNLRSDPNDPNDVPEK